VRWTVTCAGELRNTLLEFEMGVRSSGSGVVRKITPVMTRHQQQQQQSANDKNQLPLQVVLPLF